MPGLPPVEETITLNAHSVADPGLPEPPAPQPVQYAENGQLRDLLAEYAKERQKFRHAFISATVYDHSRTRLTCYPSGGREHAMTIWSNIDFNHFSGITSFEAAGADGEPREYFLLMGIGNENTGIRAQKLAERGIQYEPPEIPEIPDPTAVDSEGDGIPAALARTSKTETSYAPEPGLSHRTVTTTADNFTQTTDSFLDGRTAATHGDLAPAMAYAYNSRGERVITAIDLDNNGNIDYGTDTIQFSETVPALDAVDNPVWLTTSKVWQDNDTDSEGGGTVVSTNLRSADGLSSSNTTIGVANPSSNVTELLGNGNWTVTRTNPDNTYIVTTYVDGLMDITETFGSDDTPISWTAMRDASNDPLSGYDTLNRPTHQRDSRTGVTTTQYLSATAGVVKSVTDPGNRKTSFTYDIRGRRTHVDAPETSIAGGGTSNNLTESIYVTYTNETNGHTTPNLGYTYDALGRIEEVTRGGVLHAKHTYRPGDLQRLAEIQQIDTLDQAVTYTYEDGTNDTFAGRPNGYTFDDGTATWSYDNAGRLGSVTDGNDTFQYGYRYTLSGGLHEGITTTGGTESAMPFTLAGPEVDITLAYETTRNALAFRQNNITAGTLSKFAYSVNAIGQRDGLTPTGDAFTTTTPFIWDYNECGELTAATRTGSPAFERSYSYDGIGNRLTATDHNVATTSDFADTGATTAGGSTLNQYGKI